MHKDSCHIATDMDTEQSALSNAQSRPCGPMDKASDFGSEDCRFESCQGRILINVRHETSHCSRNIFEHSCSERNN